MIVFDLRCGGGGHVFEGWFGSSADYEDQQLRGLVNCPICGSAEVGKAPMAPAVPAKGNSCPPLPEAKADLLSAGPEQVKALLAAAAAVQRKILRNSEYVAEGFADRARAIHLGEAEERSIHGRATREEALSLAEEGVPIAPLPFPVLEPGEEN